MEEQWYVLRTVPEKEQEAVGLLERSVDRRLWTCCRILKKTKVFRTAGRLHLLEELMFPGYLFIKTAYPRELAEQLRRARQFPQVVGRPNSPGRRPGSPGSRPGSPEISPGACMEADMIPVEPEDLNFLRAVCGDDLQNVMGVTFISIDADSRIIRAEGVLNGYKDRIVKLNLRKRFALVEVKLFNRQQKILFGVWLEKDQNRAG